MNLFTMVHEYQATPSLLQYLDCACTPVSELYLSTFDPLLHVQSSKLNNAPL